MSVLVIGISHKTAPVAVLERLAMDRDGLVKLITDAGAAADVSEATVVATCNRLEIYAAVDRFHGPVEGLSQLLVDRAGDEQETVLPHLYVHYDDAAVAHLFQVTAGLDSMVVGESQILGQAREALRVGQELETVGALLNTLFQQALRIGKLVRAQTDLDHAAPSLVTAALDRGPDFDVAGRRVVVVGAGSMAAVAVSTVRRLNAADIAIVNRTPANADRLAAEYDARSLPLTALHDVLADADIVITCTGSTGHHITPDVLPAGRPLLAVDLAMPHDIDPAVADLPGVTLVNLASLGEELAETPAGQEVATVRRIVADEVAAFIQARRAASVTPTVVALRSLATSVVDGEIARLDHRLPDLDPAVRAEVVHAIRRVSDKLLHQPTVRVRELADSGGAVSYASALAELFALDTEAVDAVTRVEGLS